VKRRLAGVLVLVIMASDEATSSLDSATEREIVVLEAGTVVERGTHEALLRHKGPLRCIVGCPTTWGPCGLIGARLHV